MADHVFWGCGDCGTACLLRSKTKPSQCPVSGITANWSPSKDAFLDGPERASVNHQLFNLRELRAKDLRDIKELKNQLNELRRSK